MDEPLDPYLELGVLRTASTADITDAYHHLVRRHHPDSRPAAAHTEASNTALNRIMAAYTILKDPDRRHLYDRQHPEPSPPSRHHAPTPPTWIGHRPPGNPVRRH